MYASGWLLFTPSTYNLNIEISYTIDDKPNHDAVSYQMNVRAPLRAIIIGALVGAAIGFIVRDNSHDKLIPALFASAAAALPGARLDFWLTLVTYLIAAAMVVVAFARKKDAQPILSPWSSVLRSVCANIPSTT